MSGIHQNTQVLALNSEKKILHGVNFNFPFEKIVSKLGKINIIIYNNNDYYSFI